MRRAVLPGGLLTITWWKSLIMAVAVLAWIAGHFVQNIIQAVIQEIRQAGF